MVFKQYDPVRLRHARPDLGLESGAKGVVVDVYAHPRTAYEVEFLADNGRTLGVWTIEATEVEFDERRRHPAQ